MTQTISQRKRRLAALNEKVRKARNVLEDAEAARGVELGRTFVRCTSSVLGRGCGRMTQVRHLTYIQTHWHVKPHGCSEGDYWREGEGQFDCPKCGNRNRLYDRPEVQELKYVFKGVIDTY